MHNEFPLLSTVISIDLDYYTALQATVLRDDTETKQHRKKSGRLLQVPIATVTLVLVALSPERPLIHDFPNNSYLTTPTWNESV